MEQYAVRLTEGRTPARATLFVTRRHGKHKAIAWLLWYSYARMYLIPAYVSHMQFEQTWLVTQTKHASSCSRL